MQDERRYGLLNTFQKHGLWASVWPLALSITADFAVGARFSGYVVNQLLASPLRLFDTWEG